MVKRIGPDKFVSGGNGENHFFEITGRGTTTDDSIDKEDVNRWKESAIDLGDYKVIPYGDNNDIPNQIRDTIFPNHLAPRLQNRKVELLFEQGPYLYEEKTDGTKFLRTPIEDQEIQDWLDSVEYQQVLIERGTEFYNNEQIFSIISRLKGGRLGLTNALGDIDVASNTECRFAYRKTDLRKKPTHVIIGDWTNASNAKDFMVYPLWDRLNPTKYPFSVHYCAFKSFGVENYVMPTTYGVLPWIRRSTAIPTLIENFTENSLNLRFHITSPAQYWKEQEDKIKKNCEISCTTYKDSMMEDFYYSTMDKLSEVLSGVKNVGKFWHNQTVVKLIGGTAVEEGWKITPIKQEIKEYVESKIKIADKSDFATQAGLGLHAALANVGADGKSDSGSEQLYAWQIHQKTSTPLPEHYVTKVFNDIIPIKFGKKIKLGFYRINIERQQDISESKRLTNTTMNETTI